MHRDPHEQRVLVLDFGSQYSQLIARRVRETGVFCEIHPWNWPVEQIERFAPRGIILSGGPESVATEDTPSAPRALFELGVPVLGICYGMQTMAARLGGSVEPSDHREFGYAQVEVEAPSDLLAALADSAEDGKAQLDVWMSHGDLVNRLPPGFELLASTEAAPIAAMMDERRKLYGLQFHPEVTHTVRGKEILENFLLHICGCDGLWKPSSIIEETVERLRDQIGEENVILALSGGVDSSVVAALLHEAIDDQLTCIFVDTGLLRFRENEEVIETMAANLGVRTISVNARDRFFAALEGITDPEEKRRRIGRLFIEIFEEQAKAVGHVQWLAQGTIYPDVIESAGVERGGAHVIKSHHNVGGLPERMHLKLVEPLRELFKDEVRKVGMELGLPRHMVYRHPFPGPGLAVRVLGEVVPEYVELLQQADRIFLEELRKHDLYDHVSQAFAVFLPVKSVGVTGDARNYDYVIALRAVETFDFMTARWAHLPYTFLERVSNRIINEIRGISRVVYDISGKPPATIEWE